MAGVRLELSLESERASAALDFVLERMAPAGIRLLFADIGEFLLRSTRERAALQVAPDGAAWPALSPRYAKRKERLRPGLPLLKFDNHMLGDRLAYQADEKELLVGTSARYGARQQFGGGGIAPREWLGLTEADAAEIIILARTHFLASLEGGPAPG